MVGYALLHQLYPALDSLLKKLKANAITQKTFSESIGMNSRCHL